MCFIKRLVLGKSDIPVDPRKIRSRTAGSVKARIEFQDGRRRHLQQPAERLNKRSLVAVTVRVHPLLVVVAAKILEELKRLAGEHGLLRFHGASVSNIDAARCSSGYTIPI